MEDVLVNALGAVGALMNFVVAEFEDGEDRKWVKVTVDFREYVNMPDPAFRMHFRLTRVQCEILYNEVGDLLNRAGAIQNDHEAGVLPLSLQLLMVLWILATPDSFRSVALRFGVFPSQVHNCYVRLIKVMTVLARRYITWPTPAERERIKRRLLRYSGFPGIIGFMDGKHMTISKPKEDPAAFRNRHHTYSTVVQAVCDDNLLVRDLYVGEAGSLNDARVFRRSPLCREILFNPDLMMVDEHIVADSAYPNLNRVLTPFVNNGHLTHRQRNFNYCLSRCRSGIERTFGDLCVVWRRDYYLFSKNMDYTIDHIVASFFLHNFRIIHSNHQGQRQFNAENVPVIEVVREEVEEVDLWLDEFVPQGRGAVLLEQARALGEQKRWDICDELP